MGKGRGRYTEGYWEQKKWPKEGQFQSYVLKRLNEHPLIFAYKASDRYKAGIPDIIAAVGGWFVAIELKVRGNKPTRLQGEMLMRIQSKGGVALVAYTWGEIKDVVNYVLNKHEYPPL